MAKDYAKRVLTTPRSSEKKRVRIEFILIPVVVMLCCIAFWLYLHKNNYLLAGNSPYLARVNALVGHKPQVMFANKTKLMTHPVSQLPKELPVHFDFYNTLPSMQQMTVPVIKAEAVAAPRYPRYIIQLGVFNDQTEASQLRLSLLLAGFEVNVVKIQSSKGIIYSVQNGPYPNPLDARQLQKDMLKKGIQSSIKSV